MPVQDMWKGKPKSECTGKRWKVTINNKEGLGKARPSKRFALKHKAVEWEQDQNSRLINDDLVVSREPHTFGELLDLTLQEVNEEKRSGRIDSNGTVQNYERVTRNHIRPTLGPLPLKTVAKDYMIGMHLRLQRACISARDRSP